MAKKFSTKPKALPDALERRDILYGTDVPADFEPNRTLMCISQRACIIAIRPLLPQGGQTAS